MKNKKNQFLLSIVYTIITLIYLPIYVYVIADNTTVTSKIIASLILVALIAITITGIVASLKSEPSNNQVSNNDDVQNKSKVANTLSSLLIVFGVFVIIVAIFFIGFFVNVGD